MGVKPMLAWLRLCARSLTFDLPGVNGQLAALADELIHQLADCGKHSEDYRGAQPGHGRMSVRNHCTPLVSLTRVLNQRTRRYRRAGEGIVSDQPPWDPWQPQGQPQYPYGQQIYPQGQPQYGQQDPGPYSGQPPYQGQPYGPPGGQPPYPGQQPGYVPPSGHRGQRPWPARHKVLTSVIAVTALFVVGGIAAAASGAPAKTVTEPGPTVTVTQAAPAVTVTKTATSTVAPTANAQGQATQISSDGVYVVGTDIPGGTWHTAGGQQCYEATLASTDTSNIIDNNNFTGPDTVSLAGAKAFDISGGCTWSHES